MYQQPYNYQQPTWPINSYQPPQPPLPPNPPTDSSQFHQPTQPPNVFQPPAPVSHGQPGLNIDQRMAFPQQQGMFMQPSYNQPNALQQPWNQPAVNPFNPAPSVSGLQPIPQPQQWNHVVNQWSTQPQPWDQQNVQYQPPQNLQEQQYQQQGYQHQQPQSLYQQSNQQAPNFPFQNDQGKQTNPWNSTFGPNLWMQNNSYQNNVQPQNLVSNQTNDSSKQWMRSTATSESSPAIPPPPAQNPPPLPNEPPPPQNPPSSTKAPPPPDHLETKAPVPPEEDNQESLLSLTKQLETLETQIKTYQTEYQKWHLDFVKWQKQHQNHPDQKQYIDYQKQYQKIIEEQQSQLKQQYAELQKKISLRKALQDKKVIDQKDQLSKEVSSSQVQTTVSNHQDLDEGKKVDHFKAAASNSFNMNQNISPLVQAPIQNLPPLMQQQFYNNKRPGLNNQIKPNESALNKDHDYRNHFQKPASDQGRLFNQNKMHSDHNIKNQIQHSGNYGQLPPKFGPLPGNQQPNSGYHPPKLINQTNLPENQFVGNYSQPFENQKVVPNQMVKNYEHTQANSGQHLASEGQMFGNQNQPFAKSTNQNVLTNTHETIEDQRGVKAYEESINGVQRQILGSQMYRNQGQTPAQGQKTGSPGGPWVSRQLSDNQNHISGIPRQMHDNQGKIMGNQGEMPGNHKQMSNNQVQISSNQRNFFDNQKSLAVNQGKLSNTQRQIADNQRQSFGNQPQMFVKQGQMVDNLKQQTLNKHGRVASNQNQFNDTQKYLSGNQQKAIGIQGSGNNENFSGNYIQSSENQRQLEFQGNPPLNHVSENEKILSGNQGRMLPSRQMSPIHSKKLPKSEEMSKNFQSNEHQTNFPQNQGEALGNQEERFLNEHQQIDKDFIGDNQSKISGNKSDMVRHFVNSTSGIIIRAANEYCGAKCKFFPRCKMGKECKFEHPICATSVNCVDPHCPFEHPIGRDMQAVMANEGDTKVTGPELMKPGPAAKTSVQKPEQAPFAMGSLVTDITKTEYIPKRVYPKPKLEGPLDSSKDDITSSKNFSVKQNPPTKLGAPPAKISRIDGLPELAGTIAERVEEIYEKRKREILGIGPDSLRNEFPPLMMNSFVDYEGRKREMYGSDMGHPSIDYEQPRREMIEDASPVDYEQRKREILGSSYLNPPVFHEDFYGHDVREPFIPRVDDRLRDPNIGPPPIADDRFIDRIDMYSTGRLEVIDYAHGGRSLDGHTERRFLDDREPIDDWRSVNKRDLFHREHSFDGRGIPYERVLELEPRHLDRFSEHGPSSLHNSLYQRDQPLEIPDHDFSPEKLRDPYLRSRELHDRPRELNDRLEMHRNPIDRYRLPVESHMDLSDDFYKRSRDPIERSRFPLVRGEEHLDTRFNAHYQSRDHLYDHLTENYDQSKLDRYRGRRESPSTYMKRIEERERERNERDGFRDYQMLYERDNDERTQRDSKKTPAALDNELKPEVLSAADILDRPGRDKRPRNIVIILRGIPGAGKSYVAKLIKDKESYYGAPAPRILVLDDYFMQEVEKTEIGPDKKSKLVKKQEYIYEADMEETYRSSLLKAFNKTLADGFFPMVIVDAINNKTTHFDQFWSDAKHKGFEVYIAEITGVVDECIKRSVHKRSKDEVEKMLSSWEKPPVYYKQLDVSALLQDAAIDEVEMEEAVENSKQEEVKLVKQEEDDEELPTGFHIPKSSKWETDKEETLAKLDGITKRKSKETKSSPIFPEEDDDDDPYGEKEADMRLGKKRVRWVDIEQKKQIDHQRKIGFSIGMDWNILTDPNAQIPK